MCGKFGVGDLKHILVDEDTCYLLCNKMHNMLGQYLVQFRKNEISDQDELKDHNLLVNLRQGNYISDCDLSILKRSDGGKCIVLSFKSIYINTQTIIVIDLETRLIKYYHECFCLWETRIFSFLN